jgi:hypothetical protein
MLFLTWQGMYDAAKDEGLSKAGAATLFEHFGFSGHATKQ